MRLPHVLFLDHQYLVPPLVSSYIIYVSGSSPNGLFISMESISTYTAFLVLSSGNITYLVPFFN